MAETVEEQITRLKFAMRGWANHIFARYGHPVWLVGSALTRTDPRDVDVRVILPDEEFTARFGQVMDYLDSRWTPEGAEVGSRWAREIGKLSVQFTRNVRGINLDFQVEPASWAERQANAGKEKIRLDTTDEAPR